MNSNSVPAGICHPVERHPSGGLHRGAGAAVGGGGRPVWPRSEDCAADLCLYQPHHHGRRPSTKWDVRLFKSVIPQVYRYAVVLNRQSPSKGARWKGDSRGSRSALSDHRRRDDPHGADGDLCHAFHQRCGENPHGDPQEHGAQRMDTACIRSASTIRQTALPSAVGWPCATQELSGFITRQNRRCGWITDLTKLEGTGSRYL